MDRWWGTQGLTAWRWRGSQKIGNYRPSPGRRSERIRHKVISKICRYQYTTVYLSIHVYDIWAVQKLSHIQCPFSNTASTLDPCGRTLQNFNSLRKKRSQDLKSNEDVGFEDVWSFGCFQLSGFAFGGPFSLSGMIQLFQRHRRHVNLTVKIQEKQFRTAEWVCNFFFGGEQVLHLEGSDFFQIHISTQGRSPRSHSAHDHPKVGELRAMGDVENART